MEGGKYKKRKGESENGQKLFVKDSLGISSRAARKYFEILKCPIKYLNVIRMHYSVLLLLAVAVGKLFIVDNSFLKP